MQSKLSTYQWCIYLRYVENFRLPSVKNYREMMLRRVVFPLVGRSRSLLALATRLRHDRPDDDSRGSPEKPSKPAPETPWIKIKFWIFSFFFQLFINMVSTSPINHHFRATRPLKTLKSSPRYQNLPGDPLIAHSAHLEPLSAQSRPLAFPFLSSVSCISLSWVL